MEKLTIAENVENPGRTADSEYGPDVAAHRAAYFEQLGAIQPTGNPMEDFAAYWRIANGGHSPLPDRTPATAMRFIVSSREALRNSADASDASGDAETAEWFREESKLADRMLEANGVTAQTTDEFDSERARESGSKIQLMRSGLESFEPSGVITSDLAVFAALVNDGKMMEGLAAGKDPKELLIARKTRNEDWMAEGSLPQNTPEAIYWLEEVAGIENEMIDRIFAAHANGQN